MSPSPLREIADCASQGVWLIRIDIGKIDTHHTPENERCFARSAYRFGRVPPDLCRRFRKETPVEVQGAKRAAWDLPQAVIDHMAYLEQPEARYPIEAVDVAKPVLLSERKVDGVGGLPTLLPQSAPSRKHRIVLLRRMRRNR
jgi:hypothetical protein